MTALNGTRPSTRAGPLFARPRKPSRSFRPGEVTDLSLDHDLALWDDAGRERTGDDVVTWILEAVVTRGFMPPKSIIVHSGNPPGRRKMELGIDAIHRHAQNRELAPDPAGGTRPE